MTTPFGTQSIPFGPQRPNIVGAPGNIAGQGFLGFVVGNPEFLSSEASKIAAYWRGLEYGSDKFVGRELWGLWGQGSRMNAAGTSFSGFGAGSGQQFFPLGYVAELLSGKGSPTAKALRYLRQSVVFQPNKAGRNQRVALRGESIKGIVKNAIMAQNAYRDAFQAFDPGKRERDAVIQIFGDRGFAAGGRSAFTGKGVQGKVRFVDTRVRRPASVSSAAFRGRTGFLSGGATSGYTGSLRDFDQVFQRELTSINRLLAEGLANEVARLQEEAIKRKTTTSGRLIAATLDPRNRFPQ